MKQPIRKRTSSTVSVAAEVAKALAVHEEQRQIREADVLKRNFDLMLLRFDAVDKDNKDIAVTLANHVKDDKIVADVVKKHQTYWGLLLGLGTPTVLGVIAWFVGLIR